VEQVLDRFECSELSYSLGTHNTVSLKGHVATEEEVERLKQEVTGVPGVGSVSAEAVEVLIWPYCEVVEVLSPHKQINAERGYGLRILPSGHSERFKEGEWLVLDLVAPNFDTYLYVDYYQLDGIVVHMLPNPRDARDAENRHPANARLTIGRPELDKGWKGWEVGPPFGQEMIVIMATPNPLFPESRAESEPAKQYLDVLRQGIGGNRPDNGQFIADYFFIFTEAAQP
jgi:hypothetical protein